MSKRYTEQQESAQSGDDEAAELVRRLKSGDPDAYAILMREWYPRIYRTALSYCRSAEDAQDIVQEVFLAAYLKIHSFQGRSSIGSWLTRITVNMSLMKLRDRRRFNRIAAAHAEEMLCHPAYALSDLERAGSLAELREAIDHAVFSLPDHYCTIFILRECHAYSTSAVARALNISPATVKSRLHHARDLLRRALARHWQDQQHDSLPLYGSTWWKRAA